MDTPGAGENFLGLLIHRERPGREQEGGAVEELDQRLFPQVRRVDPG